MDLSRVDLQLHTRYFVIDACHWVCVPLQDHSHPLNELIDGLFCLSYFSVWGFSSLVNSVYYLLIQFIQEILVIDVTRVFLVENHVFMHFVKIFPLKLND